MRHDTRSPTPYICKTDTKIRNPLGRASEQGIIRFEYLMPIFMEISFP